MTAPTPGPVVAAVKRDLGRLSDPDLADSGLAATALALAAEVDSPKNSATSKSMCAKALMDALTALHAHQPQEVPNDDVDQLAAKRAARRAATAIP
jgi:hypothetical protein